MGVLRTNEFSKYEQAGVELVGYRAISRYKRWGVMTTQVVVLKGGRASIKLMLCMLILYNGTITTSSTK